MPSQLNLWANQMDPIIPQSLRKESWKAMIYHAPRTTMVYDADVRDAIEDWVYLRLLPMLTAVANHTDEGEEWRAMIDRRILDMHKFKNRTLNKILSLLGTKPCPQYGEATKLAIREIHTKRKTWRGFDVVWTKDLDIVGTLSILTNVAEHGAPQEP